jgi:CBS domain-containing protein
VNPRSIGNELLRDAPPLHRDQPVVAAVGRIVASGLPALPVVDDRDELRGIFGEREFMSALFPGYVGELGYAGFVPRKLNDALEKRAACATEPVGKYMNTEHVEVGENFSDVQVAEIFLHHRVLILPVTRDRRPVAVITRSDFFHRLAESFLALRGNQA